MRVKSVLTTMIDKLQNKLSAKEFNPTVGDFLRALEAEQSMGLANEGATEMKVRWEDPAPSLRS